MISNVSSGYSVSSFYANINNSKSVVSAEDFDEIAGVSSSSEDMVTSIDTDSNGELSEAEFSEFMSQMPPPPPMPEMSIDMLQAISDVNTESESTSVVETETTSLEDLFASLDSDENGELSEAELSEFMEQMAPPPPPPSNMEASLAEDDFSSLFARENMINGYNAYEQASLYGLSSL